MAGEKPAYHQHFYLRSPDDSADLGDADSPVWTTTAALPLPAGAATEATLATRLSEATFTARVNTQGQKTMAGSTPVVLPSDQTVPVSAVALPLPAGAATEATLATRLTEATFTARRGF